MTNLGQDLKQSPLKNPSALVSAIFSFLFFNIAAVVLPREGAGPCVLAGVREPGGPVRSPFCSVSLTKGLAMPRCPPCEAKSRRPVEAWVAGVDGAVLQPAPACRVRAVKPAPDPAVAEARRGRGAPAQLLLGMVLLSCLKYLCSAAAFRHHLTRLTIRGIWRRYLQGRWCCGTSCSDALEVLSSDSRNTPRLIKGRWR